MTNVSIAVLMTATAFILASGKTGAAGLTVMATSAPVAPAGLALVAETVTVAVCGLSTSSGVPVI